MTRFRGKFYDDNMLLKDFIKEIEQESKEEIKNANTRGNKTTSTTNQYKAM